MEPRAELYIPQVFRNFQGFQVRDIKEWRETEHMELVLEATPGKEHFCSICGCNQLGMDVGIG